MHDRASLMVEEDHQCHLHEHTEHLEGSAYQHIGFIAPAEAEHDDLTSPGARTPEMMRTRFV